MRVDGWRLFAYFCLLSGFLLILYPQIWIFVSSARDNGGSFIVRIQEEGIEWFEEASDGFSRLNRTTQTELVIKQRLGQSLNITYVDENEIRIVAPGSRVLDVESLGIKSARIQFPKMDLHVSLSTQVKIDNRTEGMQTGLNASFRDDAVYLKVPNAGVYLTFEDKRLHGAVSNYVSFLSNANHLTAVRNSLIIALISPFLASVFAVPLAWSMARYAFRFRLGIISLITMASVSPPFLGAYVWRFLFGGNGLVTNALGLDVSILGLHGVIWVIMWRVFPLIFLVSLDAFSATDPSLRESALSLGANRRRTLWNIEIPTALPGVAIGLYMAAMAAFADFSTPYIVSLDVETLPTLIYKEFLNEVGGNPSVASTASVVMVVLSVGLLSLQHLVLAGKSFASVSARREILQKPSRNVTIITSIACVIVLGMAFLPHITVTIMSFLEWNVGVVTSKITLANYTNMISSELTPIAVTLSTASIATMLSLVFGVGVGYIIVRKRYKYVSGFLNFLSIFPTILPGTVFAIGFIFVFNDKPLLLTGTWWILTLTYFIRKLPFSVKTAEVTLRQVHPALEEAAISLGATPGRAFFGVTMPIVVSGAITGMTLVFLQSVTELTSTILLFRPPWRTMSTVIFEQTITPGSNFGIAAAMTVFMMCILYVPLYLITMQRGSGRNA